MSYTINPNAKNKWARNAENTMDLSLETDASSVYLDDGRTLEQELGEGSMVSNVATVDSSISKVIDGTLDGAYESGVMYGRSLVNILNTPTATVTFNNGWRGLSPNRTLEINKKYLAIYHVETNTLDGTIKDVFRYGDNQTLWGISVVPAGGVGVFKRTFTTPHEIIHYNCYTDNSTTGSANVRCVLLEYQEGMENWDIPFFEGICDVKMPILRNVGKNLFDGEVEIGGITNETGLLNNKTELLRSKNPIRVDENTAYVLSNDKKYNNYVYFYSADDRFISYLAGRENPFKFTTPSNTHHIRIRTTESERQTDLTIKWQLEESSSVSTYEDHKTNILCTSEEIVLREVKGVCDTYNPLTGEYVQRIGEVVLDGSESWSVNNSNNEGFYSASTTTYVGKPKGAIISDKLPTITTTKAEGVMMGVSTGKVMVSFNRDSAGVSNINSFVEKLAQNPITVQYELAEPITTTVESLTTPFAYENGHIILESGYEGQSLLPTLEYSTVVNKTGLVENVAKTIQRQEKQLTMLEQMLIQNIINLDYNNTLLALKNEMEEML